MSVEDKTITCVDCNSPFTFTAGEQEFYEKKGFVLPKRCKDCRELKKRNRDEEGVK